MQDKINWITVMKLWEIIVYKKWIEVWTGKYIEDSEAEFIDDKKMFVRISNLSKEWLSFTSPKYISQDVFDTLRDYQPKEWEILFSKDWTAWIAYLLRESVEWIISWWILRFQNISKIPSEYIELVLNSILIQSEIEKMTNWALIQHLKIEDALNFNVPIIWKEKIETITQKIQQSFVSKDRSRQLLEVAKKSVEIFIEEDEKAWLKYIKENL